MAGITQASGAFAPLGAPVGVLALHTAQALGPGAWGGGGQVDENPDAVFVRCLRELRPLLGPCRRGVTDGPRAATPAPSEGEAAAAAAGKVVGTLLADQLLGKGVSVKGPSRIPRVKTHAAC